MNIRLETERLWLRPFVAEDLPAMIPIQLNPDVMRYVDDGKTCPPDQTKRFLQRNLDWSPHDPKGFLAIERKSDQALLGWCGLLSCEIEGVAETEIGYLLAKEAWGQGYATETTKKLLHHAFYTAHFTQLIAMTHPRNVPSQHVLHKCGFQLEKRVTLPKGERLIYRLISPIAKRNL